MQWNPLVVSKSHIWLSRKAVISLPCKVACSGKPRIVVRWTGCHHMTLSYNKYKFLFLEYTTFNGRVQEARVKALEEKVRVMTVSRDELQAHHNHTTSSISELQSKNSALTLEVETYKRRIEELTEVYRFIVHILYERRINVFWKRLLQSLNPCTTYFGFLWHTW